MVQEFGAHLSAARSIHAEGVRGTVVALPSLEFERLAAEVRPAWLVTARAGGKRRFAFADGGWVFTTTSSDPVKVEGARLIETDRLDL